MSKEHLLLSELDQWLDDRIREQSGSFVFLTLIFDRYRGYYLPYPSDTLLPPTRKQVENGHACAMPVADRKRALRAALDKFYCFMLRELLGGRYSKHFEDQPLGIGALDEPRYKGTSKTSVLARKTTDKFDHAHIVLFVPDVEVRGKSLLENFAQAVEAGRLEQLWQGLNPGGEVHVSGVFDPGKLLDYVFKTAKLQPVPADELILWPAAIPPRSARRPPCKPQRRGAPPGFAA